jgi:hypothetical protein
MTAPLTPNQVALELSRLARDLATTVDQLEIADRDATEKRAAYDLAFSRAFISATGAMEQRKHQAVINVHQLRLEADVGDALVRHLRRRIDAIKVRIDCARSYGAAIRAELNLSAAGVD